MKTLKLRSRIARFISDNSADNLYAFDYIPDGVIEVADGKIVLVEHTEHLVHQGYDFSNCEHLPESLIMAGFIDAHVHASQLDVVGAYGEQLLDWLNRYTFPAEIRFSDEEYSFEQTKRFLLQLFANGTTTAMAYTTSFKHSATHLFDLANSYNMRLIAGKVMMDRNAPKALLDSVASAQSDCMDLIQKWHGCGRLGYAVTPRFAGTSTPEQLRAAGELVKAVPDLWVQTHLSENIDEISWTKSLYPEASDYLNTYERFGLLTNKTTFGHCIYLTDSEIERISKSGASIAFCPSSNLFLGSGLFNIKKLKSKNIPISLCSDIGAGTSLSAFTSMGDAYKVCQLQGYSLNAREAFFMCSLGAAKSLHLDKQIGSLNTGYEADFIVLNNKNHDFISERVNACTTIDEELFVYMTCGDNRLIERTYIAGILAFQRKSQQGNFG